MDSEDGAEFLLRKAALLDVLEQIAVDLGLYLDLQGFGGAEAKIVDCASQSRARFFSSILHFGDRYSKVLSDRLWPFTQNVARVALR
jgi:hypothetical protein